MRSPLSVSGGGRGRHFDGPVGARPLMPRGGRWRKAGSRTIATGRSFRYEFFEAWADLSIRCVLWIETLGSEWENMKIFLDSKWHFQDDENTSAAATDRQLPEGNKVAAGQPNNSPAPPRDVAGVHCVTTPLAPFHPPKWRPFSPPPTRSETLCC